MHGTDRVDVESLRSRWAPVDRSLPDALLLAIARRYAEPHRAYHDVAHIEALARHYREVAAGPGWDVAIEVELAIVFHDAIYEPGSPDNEARSAALARTELAAIGLDVDRDRVAAMIVATKTHDRLDDPDDRDLAHFLDADMAILGAPPTVYARYLEDLRREYASIPAPLFRRGRRAFVEAQLARASLFHTEFFRTRLEAQARDNLERELG